MSFVRISYVYTTYECIPIPTPYKNAKGIPIFWLLRHILMRKQMSLAFFYFLSYFIVMLPYFLDFSNVTTYYAISLPVSIIALFGYTKFYAESLMLLPLTSANCSNLRLKTPPPHGWYYAGFSAFAILALYLRRQGYENAWPKFHLCLAIYNGSYLSRFILAFLGWRRLKPQSFKIWLLYIIIILILIIM